VHPGPENPLASTEMVAAGKRFREKIYCSTQDCSRYGNYRPELLPVPAFNTGLSSLHFPAAHDVAAAISRLTRSATRLP